MQNLVEGRLCVFSDNTIFLTPSLVIRANIPRRARTQIQGDAFSRNLFHNGRPLASERD